MSRTIFDLVHLALFYDFSDIVSLELKHFRKFSNEQVEIYDYQNFFKLPIRVEMSLKHGIANFIIKRRNEREVDVDPNAG